MLHRTVGELLAAKAHCKFYDVDNFHSAANKGAQPTINNMHFISPNDARAY
jgi:gluconate kinase